MATSPYHAPPPTRSTAVFPRFAATRGLTGRRRLPARPTNDDNVAPPCLATVRPRPSLSSVVTRRHLSLSDDRVALTLLRPTAARPSSSDELMCLPSPATAWLVPTIYRDASIHPTLVCPARNSASQRWCYQLGTDLFSCEIFLSCISMICILLPLSFFSLIFLFHPLGYRLADRRGRQTAGQGGHDSGGAFVSCISPLYLFSNMHKNGSWYLCTLI